MSVFQVVRNFQALHSSFFQGPPQMSMLESCNYVPEGVDALLDGQELDSYLASGIEGCRVGNVGAAPYVAAGYGYTGFNTRYFTA